MHKRRPYERLLLSIAIFRGLLGAILILFYDQTFALGGLFILIIGQLSDHIDGFIARRYSEPNIIGYFQDSLSDKLFQIGALIVASREFEISFIALWFVIARDLFLLVARVTSNKLQRDLVTFKWMSVTFALMLRGGIFVLFLTPLFSLKYQELIIIGGSAFIYLSCLIGIFSSISVLRASFN